MTLSEKQQLFTIMVANLIHWAEEHGYRLTFGEAYRTPEQAALNAKKGSGITNSLHRRLAESAATLATEKMQIPAKAGAGLPVAIPLSVPTSRAALSAAAISEAQKAAGAGFSLDGLKQQLGEFTQLRDSLINDVASGLADLQGKSARAWVFTASGDTAATLLALVKDIPQPSAVYTAAIMLAGKNLDGIRGMIHDVDPDTGA